MRFWTLGSQKINLRQCLLAIAILALLALPRVAHAEDYRLAPGDVLRVVIVGYPELTVDVPLEMDGTAWFPLVGPIAAGGETLRDIRSRTAEAYATISISRPVAIAGETPQIIDSSQVLIAVAAYRPIYVTGNTGAVHEIPYRVGLTLRHLIALTSAAPARDIPQTANATEIDAVSAALAHEYAQIWRHKSILGTNTPEDFDRIFVAKGPAFDEIATVERSILEETRAAHDLQLQQLRDEVARLEARIPILNLQRETESKGLAMDEQTLAEVQDLFTRNLVPASRLTDVRRAALVTASRVFQIDVALENARGQVAALKANILSVDSDARVRALNDLGAAVARLQQRRADFEALLATGGAAQTPDLAQTETTALITRDGVALPPGETTLPLPLMPGDIVEFRQRPLGSTMPAHAEEANG